MADGEAFFSLNFLFEDEEEANTFDDALLLCAVAAAVERQHVPKIELYAESTVPRYSSRQFQRFFRVSRCTFELLIHKLEHFDIMTPSWTGGRFPIPIDKQLMIALWYISSQETIYSISDRFDVTESSVVRCRTRVFEVITDHLMKDFIVWPNNAERQYLKAAFIQNSNFPGVVGCLDGSHIAIKAPSEHPDTYVNRKGYHSLVLQAVCREDLRFTHCVAGWPGSCHDARVLKNSDLWDTGLAKCGDGHLVGDAAYPIRRWLMTPFRDNGHLTPAHRRFNNSLSTVRVTIERAFGLLKGRFRRLQLLDTMTVETAVHIILASCVMHNICILNEDEVEEYMDEDRNQPRPRPNPNLHENEAEGGLKRMHILRNL